MNTNNSKNNFLLLLCCFILITTFVINYTSVFDLQSGTIKKPIAKDTSSSASSQVLVFSDKILVPRKTSANSFDYFELNPQATPQLFDNTGQDRAFSIEEVSNSALGNTFIIITQKIFVTADYIPRSFVIYNYDRGNVVYQSPLLDKYSHYTFDSEQLTINVDTDPYAFYSTCMSCRLHALEFQQYDLKQDKFVLVNNLYADQFKKLLTDYASISQTKCLYQNQITPATDLLANFGADARCQDELDPSGKNGGNASFLTVGQFLELNDKISKVISGQNLSLLPN